MRDKYHSVSIDHTALGMNMRELAQARKDINRGFAAFCRRRGLNPQGYEGIEPSNVWKTGLRRSEAGS